MWGENIVLIANTIIGTLFATTVGFAIAWARARERALRAELTRQRLAPDAEARFDRLQQAVEAMAVEVERISEAQRFAAKLLAERTSPAAGAAERPRAPERVITPH